MPADASSNGAIPTGRELEALLELLADDDPRIHGMIRDKFLSYGDSTREILEPHTLSEDPVIRRRTREILNWIARSEADAEFLNHCRVHKADLDLETAIWMLARTRFPDICVDGYRAMLDNFSRELLDWVDFGDPDFELLQTINRYFFEHYDFGGNEEYYYDPENSYMNRVIDRRTGNPISLCTVFLLVCKRLQLPVTGIGMPGHFLCRYQSNRSEIFIDTFHKGRLLSRKDCVGLVQASGLDFSPKFLTPATPSEIIKRMCMNLHHIHLQQGDREEAQRFTRYLAALGG